MTPLPPQLLSRTGNTLLLNLVFRSGGFGLPKLDSWLKVFVQKLDLSANEYQTAYELWKVHSERNAVEGTVTFTLPAAGDHLELCVLSLRRALRCFDHLRTSRNVPAFDRILRRRIKHVSPEIIPIRNAVEHIDERIGGGLEADQPHTLRISDDGTTAAIADESLRIEDIRRCITLLQEVAYEFVTYRRQDAQQGVQPGSPTG